MPKPHKNANIHIDDKSGSIVMTSSPRYYDLRARYIKILIEREYGTNSENDAGSDAFTELDPNVYDTEEVMAALSAVCHEFTDDWLFEPGAVLPMFLCNLIKMCQENVMDAALLWVEERYGDAALEELAEILVDGKRVMQMWRKYNGFDESKD